MNKTTNAIIAAAVSGILLGITSGCAADDAAKPNDNSTKEAPAKGDGKSDTAPAAAEKNICKGRNSCKNKGGCKSAGGCAGKNECKGKGGCATYEHHTCGGKNNCKNQGGCGKEPGKNACEGKGTCHVPLKKMG